MDNKPVYRMSGIGGCPKELSAEHLNYPQEPAPAYLMAAAREGSRQDIWMKQDLIKAGISV